MALFDKHNKRQENFDAKRKRREEIDERVADYKVSRLERHMDYLEAQLALLKIESEKGEI